MNDLIGCGMKKPNKKQLWSILHVSEITCENCKHDDRGGCKYYKSFKCCNPEATVRTIVKGVDISLKGKMWEWDEESK